MWIGCVGTGCSSRCPSRAVYPALASIQDHTNIAAHRTLTLHGLLSSKPAGAFGLSVCPLRKPVSLRSRSITAACRVSQSCSIPCSFLRTLPVPLIHRVSLALSAVLHVSQLGKSGAREAEELMAIVSSVPGRGKGVARAPGYTLQCR